MKLVILYQADKEQVKKWELACKKRKIDYILVDLFESNWLNNIRSLSPDLILTKPPGDIELNKLLFDERLYILSKVLKIPVFPSCEETVIYENKKMLSYYLEAKSLPHSKTRIFNTKGEAIKFFQNCSYPVVLKSSIGASGSGVKIVKSSKEACEYVKKAFSDKGIPIIVGPNRVTGNLLKWIKKAISDPQYAKKRINQYKMISDNRPKNYVICQEYIPHDFEWRAARIGNSYFAHKKIKYKDKCSGTKGIDYVNPPLKLLDFVRKVCEENKFNSVALDIFEHNGQYLINEIQTIFGHVQDHILEVDGKPGRYIYESDGWVFEEGMFNSNESYDLRLEVALDLYNKGLL